MMSKVSVLLLFLLAGSLTLQAQNLVPNGGFEDFKSAPNSDGDMDIPGWFNPNPTATGWPNSTPDHLHSKGSGNGNWKNSYFAELPPKAGQGYVGLVEYNPNKDDFREYVAVELTSPLEVGRTYTLTFYLAKGLGRYYGCEKATGFGIYLGEDRPLQDDSEPLRKFKPMFELPEAFGTKDWTEFTFTFEADKPHKYLMLGNFLKDKDQETDKFTDCSDPFVITFLDEVSLTPGEKKFVPEPMVVAVEDLPEGEEERELAAMKSKDAPKTFMGREITLSEDVGVHLDEITLEIWDNLIVDGDTISLQFNGEWLLENHMVSKTKVKIPIKIDPSKNNLLVLHAHNLGRMPPNTAEIAFVDKAGKRQVLTIKSDYTTSGAIRFTREE